MLDPNKTITIGRLVSMARDLIDSPGSNPEYERALIQLVIAAAGLSQNEHRAEVANAIGVHSQP